MQTIDRVQIENVIAQLSAIMQGALLMPERRKDDRRALANKTQGGAPGIAHQVREPAYQVSAAQVAPAPAQASAAPMVQPKQPKDAPRKPAQDARPVAATWPFETYAVPKRPFEGFLWPYELKKMSQARRDEYFRKLNTGEIGPDDDQTSALDDGDRRGKAPGRKAAPGKSAQEREREEVLARFAELDRELAQAGEPLLIDFGTHSAAYQAIMINCLNKGMPTRAAHNFAAKKAYGSEAILF